MRPQNSSKFFDDLPDIDKLQITPAANKPHKTYTPITPITPKQRTSKNNNTSTTPKQQQPTNSNPPTKATTKTSNHTSTNYITQANFLQTTNNLLKPTANCKQHLAKHIDPQSQLYKILNTDEYLYLEDPNTTSKLPLTHKLSLAQAIDTLLASVPHSIKTYYIILLAATYETLDLDIPYEIQYVARTTTQTKTNNPYKEQAKAFGLDVLLDYSFTNEQHHFPLLNLPDFPSHTYRIIMQTLHLDPTSMARSFLTTLLQTEIRNCELLTSITQKTGPKLQSYAAATKSRLDIAAKPKKIPNLKPIVPTKYPCAKCITTATILTTTEQKYTEKLLVAPRFKSLDEYTKTLPLTIRKKFLETFDIITSGYPNHQEIKGCPLANHPEKRSAFNKIAPNKLSPERQAKESPSARNADVTELQKTS